MSEMARQVLCFRVADQDYAVEILEVKEIRRYTPTTLVPDAPSYMIGVINLRGTVVPVFDLRMRFGTGAATIDRNTAIIVVTVGPRNIGIVVDSVTRVLKVSGEMLRPVPQFARSVESTFLLGLIQAGEQLVTWLDVPRLLGAELEAA